MDEIYDHSRVEVSVFSIRLLYFVSACMIMMIAEHRYPRRPRVEGRWTRWPVNISMTLLNSLFARFTVGAVPYQVATSFQSDGHGLLNVVGIGGWAAILITWVLLEGVIYWQHRLFHKIPLLWRLHQVHHSDRDLDFTSGTRFHPFEILGSLLIKVVVVAFLGADPLGYLIFEISLNIGSIFNHSNVRLPLAVDRALRWILVTPDMHRIHHSVEAYEHHRNFSFTLSIFDRIFGSYCGQPNLGQEKVILGLREYNEDSSLSLGRLLKMPFQQKP